MKRTYKSALSRLLAAVLLFALMAPGLLTLAAAAEDFKTDAEALIRAEVDSFMPIGTDDLSLGSITTLSGTGFTVSVSDWESSNTEVLSHGGAINVRPAYNAQDVTVNLTATYTITETENSGTYNDSVVITVTVRKAEPSDAEAVAAAKVWLGWNRVTSSESASNVTTNFTLPSYYDVSSTKSVTFDWSSSIPSAVSISGTSATVTQGASDVSVTLTAEIFCGDETDTKEIAITVKKLITDRVAVDAALAALNWALIRGNVANTEASVTANLSLPRTVSAPDAAGVTILWAAELIGGADTSIVSSDGTVTRPNEDTVVILTATAKKGSVTGTKPFTINVKAKDGNTAQDQVDAATAWLKTADGWNSIRGSNTDDSSRYDITHNLNLPVNINRTHEGTEIKDVVVSWTLSLSGGSLNGFAMTLTGSNAGRITAWPSKRTDLTLTGTLSKTGAGTNSTVTFDLRIDPQEGREMLEAVANWITWDRIRGDNVDRSATNGYEVFSDLNLMEDTGTTTISGYDRYDLDEVVIDWDWEPNNTASAYDVDINLRTGKINEFPTRDSRGNLVAYISFDDYASNYVEKEFDVIFKAGGDQAQIDAVQNWLTWNVIRGSNAAQSNTANNNTTSRRLEVTSNLILNPTIPSTLDRSSTDSTDIPISGITISWAASPSRITSTGVVTFPASGSTQVTLTATIRKGNSSTNQKTKTFYLLLLPATDQAVVNEAMNGLTWNVIRAANPSDNSAPFVTYSDLNLPTIYKTEDGENVTIRWSTSNPSYVRTNGTVTPPNSGSQTVTLTAVFTYKSITSTATENNPNSKTFSLTVRRPTDREAVSADRDSITWDLIKRQNTSQTAVISDLDLPTTGGNGSSITWSSSNTSVVSNYGDVTRPVTGNVTVALTATIRSGSVTDTKTINITVLSIEGESEFVVETTANGTTATISREGFANLSENGTQDVEAKMGGNLTVTFNAKAAETIYAQSNGNIVITARLVPSSEMPSTLRTQIGDRAVYDLSVLGGNRSVTQLNGGTATVKIPYNLRLGEKPNALVMYHIDSSAIPSLIRGFYNSATNQIIFKSKHFSRFAIGYNPRSFLDIEGSWAEDSIEFIAARGLTVGIPDISNNFEPDKALSRGEFTANLMKAYGVALDPTATVNFTDVSPQSPYAPYLATAKKMGIVAGTNTAGTTFEPERQIGRAEMFALLYNILKAIGELPPPITNGKTLSSFTDAGSVSSWFREGVEALLQAGMIDGTGGTILDPLGKAKRATMAGMLHNLLTR